MTGACAAQSQPRSPAHDELGGFSRPKPCLAGIDAESPAIGPNPPTTRTAIHRQTRSSGSSSTRLPTTRPGDYRRIAGELADWATRSVRPPCDESSNNTASTARFGRSSTPASLLTRPAPGQPKRPATCCSVTPTSSRFTCAWFVIGVASSSTPSMRCSGPKASRSSGRPSGHPRPTATPNGGSEPSAANSTRSAAVHRPSSVCHM
jgi:hypothetical protein